MSAFGKYGTGGPNPGNYNVPSDDNSGNFTADMGKGSAFEGTGIRSPDSFDDYPPQNFGAPEHNPPHMNPKASV